MEFIFDTGASDVSISLTEALFMIRHGYLKEENILGNVQYSIANGDIAEGTSIIIDEIEIAGIKLTKVKSINNTRNQFSFITWSICYTATG